MFVCDRRRSSINLRVDAFESPDPLLSGVPAISDGDMGVSTCWWNGGLGRSRESRLRGDEVSGVGAT